MDKYQYYYEASIDIYADSIDEADEVFKYILPVEGKGSFSLGGKTINYLIHDTATDSMSFEGEQD